jgi:acetolactate synthase regulatory subunit
MNVLSLARTYRVYEARAFETIVVATAASVATVTIAVILVVNGVLPVDPFR